MSSSNTKSTNFVSKVNIVDSHAHLWMKDFDKDRDAVICSAKESNVSYIIDIGAGNKLEGNHLTLAISKKYPNIFSTIGLHPHDADYFVDDNLDVIENLIQNDKVVALGEIGLDKFKKYSSFENQLKLLKKQIAIANNHKLPVVLHVRDAHDDVISVLKEIKCENGGIVHCYSGNVVQAKIYMDMGFYISIPGVVTYKNNTLVQVVESLPLENLLVETDCPFLAPADFRGKRNEPAYVVKTLLKVAEIKKVSLEDAAKVTTNNAKKVFNLKL